MKINSNLDQPSKKYAGFLISHIQLLSALLMILSVGSICGVKPAAENPWLLLRLILPRTAESRVLQQYSSADFFLFQILFYFFFFPEGAYLAFDFFIQTINRWGSFMTVCVL